jgi:hypothetical protein
VPDQQQEKRNGFYPVQMRLVIAGQPETISLCNDCAALVLASERSQKRHRQHHELIEQLAQTVAHWGDR